MKSEQTEDEFWYNIFQLADYKRLGKWIAMKDPAGWDRFIQEGQVHGLE